MEPDYIYQRPPKICLCKDVTLDEIVKSIEAGNNTVELIAKDTGATTGCGTCIDDVEGILKNSRYYKQ